jgi:hypothetical protein
MFSASKKEILTNLFVKEMQTHTPLKINSKKRIRSDLDELCDDKYVRKLLKMENSKNRSKMEQSVRLMRSETPLCCENKRNEVSRPQSPEIVFASLGEEEKEEEEEEVENENENENVNSNDVGGDVCVGADVKVGDNVDASDKVGNGVSMNGEVHVMNGDVRSEVIDESDDVSKVVNGDGRKGDAKSVSGDGSFVNDGRFLSDGSEMVVSDEEFEKVITEIIEREKHPRVAKMNQQKLKETNVKTVNTKGMNEKDVSVKSRELTSQKPSLLKKTKRTPPKQIPQSNLQTNPSQHTSSNSPIRIPTPPLIHPCENQKKQIDHNTTLFSFVVCNVANVFEGKILVRCAMDFVSTITDLYLFYFILILFSLFCFYCFIFF